jgi:hypothetical protein
MLNLKKGLALVLAAATAFTFAPVANLGAAVDANAASYNFIDTDQETLHVSKTGTIKVSIKDLTKNPTLSDSGYNTLNVKSSDKNKVLVRFIGTGESQAAAESNNSTVSASAITGNNVKDGQIEISGVEVGSAVVTVSAHNSKTNSDLSDSFTVVVDDTVAYINVAKDSYTATKVADGDFRDDPSTPNSPANQTAAITPTVSNLPSVAGSQYKWTYASSDEKVAVPTAKETSWQALTAPTDSTTAINYTGVGKATITVSLVRKLNGNEKAILNAKISVTIKDATDTLQVSYDSNRDGQNEDYKLTGAINEKGNADGLRVTAGNTTHYAVTKWDTSTHKEVSPEASATASDKVASKYMNTGSTIYLDTVSNKSAKINISDALGRPYHVSSTSPYFDVDNAGNVTISDKTNTSSAAYGAHDGFIVVTVDRLVANTDDVTPALTIYIPVAAQDRNATTLTVKKPNGQVIATAVGAENVGTTGKSFDDYPVVHLSTKDLKSLQVTVESNAGDGFVSGVVNAVDSTDTPDFTKFSDIVSYDNATKTITATAAGKAIVSITSRNSNKTYNNATVRFGVEVVTKNANNQIKAPATINLTKSSRTASIGATTTYPTTLSYDIVTGVGSTTKATSSDITVDGSGNITYTSENKGTAVIRIQGAETVDALKPDAAYVTVNYGSEKAASPLKVTTKSLELGVDETAPIVATAGSVAVTYTSSDDSIATVDANGTVTAKAAGAAFITVKAAETDDFVGAETLVPVIVNGDKTVAPEKVTSLKVSNKKGAYVSVKWTSQGKNINYRVYKKVGNGKWVGKNVAGNKTTLSVKKGAKVQVKVKSYVKNAAGKTTWGPSATKAKTFKTDKK